MSEKEEKSQSVGLMAKKILLEEEYGLSAERVNSIQTSEDADILIKHYQSKKNVKPEEKDLKAQFIAGGKAKKEGEDGFEGVLGPADKVRKNKHAESLEAKIDPLHPANEARRNEQSRSAMVFVDGKWRLF